jgi:hypothetical protein
VGIFPSSPGVGPNVPTAAVHLLLMPNRRITRMIVTSFQVSRITRMIVTSFQVSPPRGVLMPRSVSASAISR